MRNELLWVIFALFSLLGLWGAKKLFGVTGLYIWMALSIVAANVTVIVTITLFGLTATLGGIMYGSSFAVTDSLFELEGKRGAQKAVWIGFFVQICFTAIISITLLFAPHESDFAYPHLKALFQLLPRITLASLTAYLASQLYDVWIFEKIRKIWPGRRTLWVRNNLSTLSSQLIDTSLFCIIAFYGVFPISVVRDILLTTYLFKVIVALLDTPFVYLLTKRATPAYDTP